MWVDLRFQATALHQALVWGWDLVHPPYLLRILISLSKVCKFFLEAIDKGLYGWFWTCPNGGDKCKYRHALPPGFILKKKEQKQDKDEISLEELIEEERAKLGTNLTKITLETFTTWKKRKVCEILN